MYLQSIILTMAAMIWGFTFIATRWTLNDFSPLWTNSFRYTIAIIPSLPILLYYKSYKRPLKELIYAFNASLLLFLAMHTQTVGLKYTTVTKNSFITTLYALFTPVMAMYLYKQSFSKKYWGVVALALIGMAFLCNLTMSDINIGDIYTLLCAVIMAGHIIYIDRVLKYFDSSFEFNSLQCFFIGIYGFVFSTIWEGPINLAPLLRIDTILKPSPLAGMLIAGILSSFIAFSFQAYAQKKVPPHIVSIIFLMEAPFASFFGIMFLNESLTRNAILGAILVTLSALLVSQVSKQKVIVS